MSKILSIGVSIAWAGALVGCSGGENPLQGTWQGTLEISGAISAEPLATANQPQEAAATELATLTLQFLPDQRLKLSTQPTADASTYPAAETTAAYEIVEQLPDQIRLRLVSSEGAKENRSELQIRFTGPNALTLSEAAGNPRLLPVAMTRVKETP